MYSIEERAAIQSFLIAKAQSDNRILDAAIVGSESIGENDKWSDIDLTFGVKEGVPIEEILNDWTNLLHTQYDADLLFDLPYQGSIYRVFLLSNCLQIDLSFTPSSKFGATTPKFKLLFGEEKSRPNKTLPNIQVKYGYATLYALKVRCSIERKKYWQTIHYLNELRESIQQLACLKYGLNPFDGRGYDELPNMLKNQLQKTLTISLNDLALREALKNMTKCLITLSKDMMTIKKVLDKQLIEIGNL